MEAYLHKKIHLIRNEIHAEIHGKDPRIVELILCKNHVPEVGLREHRAVQRQVLSTAGRPGFTLSNGESKVRLPTSPACLSPEPVDNRPQMARADRSRMAGSPPRTADPEELTMTDPTCPVCREPAADTTERTKRGIAYADYICPNQHLWHSHWLLPAIPVDPPDQEAS